MPTFSIVRRPKFRVEALDFTPGEMRELGDLTASTLKNRLDVGLNRFDEKMPPLTKSYRKRKVKRGRKPIRDLLFSGSMRTATRVKEATGQLVTVSIAGATLRARGFINQAISPWFGLSPMMGAALDKRIFGLLDEKMTKLRGTRGIKKPRQGKLFGMTRTHGA